MQLDDDYANAAYIEGADQFPPRWQSAAAAFRKKLGFRAQKNISYGPTDREVYDFFEPEGVSRGTVIFVHGGFWRRVPWRAAMLLRWSGMIYVPMCALPRSPGKWPVQ